MFLNRRGKKYCWNGNWSCPPQKKTI